MRVLQLILTLLAIFGFVLAREILHSDNFPEASDKITGLTESRKRKPFHDLYFLTGGIHSLIAFFLIKLKIVVIATIIGVAVFAFKLFSLLKYSGHFYKSQYPSYEISSYPGPPFTSYSSSPHDDEVHDWSSHGTHYSRSTELSPSLNITEIVHSFANIDKEDCRARLFCEFENIFARSPFFDYFTRLGVTRKNFLDSKHESGNCTAYYEKCFVKNSERRKRRSTRRRYATRYPPFVRRNIL